MLGKVLLYECQCYSLFHSLDNYTTVN